MKCFVTGADGFIGSHLCEALRDAGHEVTGLALYNSFDTFGWLDEVDGVRKVRGDVRDAEQMRKFVTGQDVVFHLAALISVPYSFEYTESQFVQTNVQGTTNVLAAARDAGVRLFVQTSSSEVYGTRASSYGMNERHVLNPQSPYAVSKLSADLMALAFHKAHRLPVVVLRPFNTYGPRQSERALIPATIRQVIDPRCEFVRVGSLETKRDYTFVSDTCSAFLSIMDSSFGTPRIGGPFPLIGEVVNCGSEKSHSGAFILDTIMALTGITKPVAKELERVRPLHAEVMDLEADASSIAIAANWRAKTTMLDGLERTIEWWRTRTPRKDLAYVA